MANKKYTDFEESSGNVFADLGIPNAEEYLAKAELAYQINSIIKKRGLKQVDAAKLLGIDQPKISALVSGRLSGFSMERLFRFLTTLNHDVVISIKPRGTSGLVGLAHVLVKRSASCSSAVR